MRGKSRRRLFPNFFSSFLLARVIITQLLMLPLAVYECVSSPTRENNSISVVACTRVAGVCGAKHIVIEVILVV